MITPSDGPGIGRRSGSGRGRMGAGIGSRVSVFMSVTFPSLGAPAIRVAPSCAPQTGGQVNVYGSVGFSMKSTAAALIA